MFGEITRADEKRLAENFARDGLVRVCDFLPATAAVALHNYLRGSDRWNQLFNSGDKVVELDRSTYAALSPRRKAELDKVVYAGARSGFQYRYETIRVPDDPAERASSQDLLNSLAQWLSTGETRSFFRRLTGDEDIEFADAQGTAYSPGDFLTGHDDAIEGKSRRAAYILSLTPTWRLEWGGLLIMHGQGDQPAQAYVPQMNVLTIFKVGQMHSVSEVTRSAAYRRYSVTGWLRASGSLNSTPPPGGPR